MPYAVLFVFDERIQLDVVNALENVALPLTFQGMDKAARLARADKVLDLVNLKKHKKHNCFKTIH